MLENKTYERLSISVEEMEQADVVTASGLTTVSWRTAWGESWDDYNVGEDWQ